MLSIDDLFYEGSYERCEEPWDSELKKIKTPYYATVDADFEILQPDFYFKMMEELSKDKKLVTYSTDYTPTSVVYDTYSDDTIIAAERWHTWFCIYKQEAQICKTSHRYYEFIMPNNMRFTYDSS